MFRIALALLISQGAWASKVVVAGTAAVLGEDVVTITDTYFYRAVRDLVDDVGISIAPVGVDELKKAANRLVFEHMVMGEIKSLRTQMTLRANALSKWDEIKKKEKRYPSVLKEYSKTENEIVDVIWRRIEVEAFLQKKVETLTPIITDAEIERYFQLNQSKFPQETLENQRGNIRILLQKQRVEKSLEEWIRFLREKYAVVNMLGGQ